MTAEQVRATIDAQEAPMLPDPNRTHTPGEYFAFIGCLVDEAHRLMHASRAQSASLPSISAIAAVALQAIEKNGGQMGLALYDRASIYTMAERFPAPDGVSVTESLLDIESIVLRYKAHRPQLRGPDAGPKLAANLIEVLAIAMAVIRRSA